MARTRWAILAPLAAVMASACAEAGTARPRAERADSAGMEIVRSPGKDHPLDWTFEPVLSLGGADDGPESFYELGAGFVATDARGNLYVLDHGNYRVAVFDSAGKHLRTMGRKGGGPGEMQFPIAISVTPEGEVGVFDLMRHSLLRFGPDGEILEPNALDRTGGVGKIAYTPGGLLVSTRRMDRERSLDVATLALQAGGAEPAAIASLEQPLGKPVSYPNCPVQISSMLPIFAPSLEWAAAERSIAVSRGPEYRIDVHEGARLLRSIRRAIPPAAATPELAAGTVRDGEMKLRFGSGECRIPASDVVEAQGFAPTIPAIDELAVAPDGTVWVRRATLSNTEDGLIDVFDHTGEYLGTLPADSPYPVAFTPRGDVIAVEKDELDLSHVRVYRVDRSSAGASESQGVRRERSPPARR
jgi:hypothetical protein